MPINSDTDINRFFLTDSIAGSFCRVHHVDAIGADGIRLKRLGICEGRRIEVIQIGDPLILRVIGSRVGLSRRLASLILVEGFDSSPSFQEGDTALRELAAS